LASSESLLIDIKIMSRATLIRGGATPAHALLSNKLKLVAAQDCLNSAATSSMYNVQIAVILDHRQRLPIGHGLRASM
jgi:hypothetical protein